MHATMHTCVCAMRVSERLVIFLETWTAKNLNACVCFANVIVKRPALLLPAVDGCYRNPLYYYYMHTNIHLHAYTSMHTHM